MNSVFAEEVKFGDNCAAEKIAHTHAQLTDGGRRDVQEPAGKSCRPHYLSVVS